MTDPTPTKICPECGSEFRLNAGPKGGLNRIYCSRNCTARVANRKQRETNREKMRAAWRASHHRNKEKKNAYCRDWAKRNQEYVKTKSREYYAAHRSELIERNRAYYHANRERLLVEQREYGHTARRAIPWKGCLKASRMRAAKSGIEHTLTEEWCAARWTGKCELTGIEFVTDRKPASMRLRNPSLDRIDPTRGYTPDNCRFILWSVNSFKHTGSDSDIRDIAKALLANSPLESKA